MPRKKKKNNNYRFDSEIKAIFFATIAGLCMASLFLPEHVGQLGNAIRRILFVIAGRSSIALPFFLLIYSFKLMFSKEFNIKINNRVTGIIIFYWTFLLVNHVYTLVPVDANITSKEIIDLGLQGEGGGILGAVMATVFLRGLGVVGTIITSISFMVIGLILILDISISKVLKFLGKGLKYLYSSLIKLILSIYKKIK